MNKDNLIIFCDGGSRGNPGKAGLGSVIYDEDKNVLKEISKYIGIATNNQAEYKAVLAAIKEAKKIGAKKIKFFLDSELIVKQMSGEYRVKNKELLTIYLDIRQRMLEFKSVNFFHVPREQNKEADRLANLAMDREK
jgi:ribonuclease HI